MNPAYTPRASLWIWVLSDEVRGTGPDAASAIIDAQRRLAVMRAEGEAADGYDPDETKGWDEERDALHTEGYPLEVRGHLADLQRTRWLTGARLVFQHGQPVPDPLHRVPRRRVYRTM